MFKRVMLAAAALGFVMFLASSADANILLPNTSAAPDVFTTAPPASFLADTGILPFTTMPGTTIAGTYRAVVFADPGNLICANCLTFLYQVSNSMSSTEAIQRITTANFSGFTTDVGYNTANLTGFSGSTVSPGTVNRDLTGGVVGFNYLAGVGPGSVPSGSNTVNMEIMTNATLFSFGTLSVIDSGVATVTAFAPIPEPNSLALLSSGVLGLVGASWRRQRRPMSR